MTGRVALIPGGARGIGRGIALDLARAGWSVAVCYRTSAGAAAETQAALEAAGARAMAIKADVSDPAAVQDLVARVDAAWGRIDALVQCAGPYHKVDLLAETPAGWREMLDNNLDPLFYLARLVAPGMIARRWGRILAFAMAGADELTGHPAIAAYAIAKTGVLVLVRALARALAPHGITVNAISPGFIDSGSDTTAALDEVRPKVPAGYVGEVADAVAAARFFLSEEARYVTGANLPVSGGYRI